MPKAKKKPEPVVETPAETKPAPSKFWMLFNSSGGAPVKRHTTLPKAIAEATRIVKKQPWSNCYILEAIGYVNCAEPQGDGSFGPVMMHELTT